MFKTDEEEEEDDSDQQANELFNSLLKKGHQSETLSLLESFQSEYDSVDLSERHLNDEHFRIATKAFQKIQTMDAINTRHEDDP
jgi:hypothetical protein